MPMSCSKTCNTPFMQLNAALMSCNTGLTFYQEILKAENNQLPHGTLSLSKALNVWMWLGGCRQGWLFGCFEDERPVCGVGVFGRVDAVSVGQGSAYLLSSARCVSGSWRMDHISPGVTCTRSLQWVSAKAGCKSQAHVLVLRTHHLLSTQTALPCLRFPRCRVVCEMPGWNTSAFMPYSGSGWAVLSTTVTWGCKTSHDCRMRGKNKGKMVLLDFANHS